uniref:Uncharacterized protein n=1 Tax=Oryza punctata TaxID=4537 RepID=A0A0E0M675_ORYPU
MEHCLRPINGSDPVEIGSNPNIALGDRMLKPELPGERKGSARWGSAGGEEERGGRIFRLPLRTKTMRSSGVWGGGNDEYGCVDQPI